MRIGGRGGQGDMPRSGLRRSDSERINAIAHDAHVPVDEVLKDVAEFRLALETDMIIAAAAADTESPELLSEVLDGERLELADFHDRLLERLVNAAASDELAARRERRTPMGRTAKAVASVAAVLAFLGMARVATSRNELPDNRLALATASQQYADLSSAVSGSSSTSMTQAAADLHETLENLITEHAGDPAVAQQTAALLQAEITLLEKQDPTGARHVIAQARTLVNLLKRTVPPNVRASVAPMLEDASSPEPKQSASPKPSPSPSPKATTASPKPTSSPKASASSSASAGEDDSPLRAP